MSGYIRQDTGNNISNGQVADADVLDSEFNALVSAFNSSTGHSHNGTTAEGAAITVVGPAQDVVVSGTAVLPKTTATYDLGSTLLEWKDLWAGGTSTLASLIATTADINAGTVDGTIIGGSVPAAITGTTVNGTTITASVGFVGSVTGNLTSSNAVITGGSLNNVPIGAATASTVRGTVITATTNFAGPLTGAVTGNVTGNLTGNVTGNTTGIHTGAITSSAVTITGGTISGITDLAVADGGTGSSTAAGALVNLGLTATAAEINKLNGVTSSTAELNKLTGVTATTAEINRLVGITAAGQALIDDANAAAQRTTLGLAIGTDVQAYDPDLTAIAALSGVQGDLLYRDGTQWQRLPKGTAGQVLRQNTGLTAPEWVTERQISASVSTTSGTAFDFTTIPSWATKVTIFLSGVSLSGLDDLLVQIGTGGVPATSGYISMTFSQRTTGTSQATSASGFIVRVNDVGEDIHGEIELNLINGVWHEKHIAYRNARSEIVSGAGAKTYASTVDIIRVTRSGTDTFDAGSISVMWE